MEITPVLQADDFKKVEALATVIWKEHYTPIIGRAQVEYMLANFQSAAAMQSQIEDGYEYYLVQSEDKPIGYLAFKIEDHELFLSKIYLLKENRGRGHGRTMMAFVEEVAHQRGARQLRLTVNKYNHGSIKAYQQLGFTKTRELVQDIGHGYVMDDFEFIKSLH